jgi:hypothetical protein
VQDSLVGKPTLSYPLGFDLPLAEVRAVGVVHDQFFESLLQVTFFPVVVNRTR